MRQVHDTLRRAALTAILAGAAAAAGTGGAAAASPVQFDMVRSNGLPATCAPRGHAHVTVTELGFSERFQIKVEGFKANTTLALFFLQVPNAPFGIGWYLADLTTDATGKVTRTLTTRANDETFAVAVGNAPAPKPHGARDAVTNPKFKPVHTYHVGVWFDSVADSVKNGCPAFTTPFNGDHTAGPQVLNTGTFPNNFGPLRRVF
jgi:hypothetical protein